MIDRKTVSTNTLLAALVMASLATACADDGEPGATGPAGPAGMDGMNGMDGDPGTPGTPGMNGMDGMDGEDGEPGDDGDPGAAGMDGMDGAEGSAGAPGMDGMNGAPGFARGTFYVSNNGTANAGSLDRVNESFARTRTTQPGNNEGILFTRSADLIQAGDTSAGASIRTFCTPEHRAAGAMFMPSMDHEIAGASTGLVNPKGIAIAHRAGFIFVANFMDMTVKVFGSAAAGDQAPFATTTLAGNAWDLTYDEPTDRLFVALTNGTVAVFDDYVASGFSGPADRTITPADSAGTKVSVNLHGIVYDAASDRLVVSDVGDAASATDGAIFVIESASTADGNVEPSRSIAGPATMLGNPVDIILTGADLRVAEKAGDALLIFADIFDGPSGDVAPTLAVPSTKPEALAEYDGSWTEWPSVSDIDSAGYVIPTLAYSSNPGPAGGTLGSIFQFSSALNAMTGEFDAGMNLESITLDHNGDVFATFDDGASAGGGIYIGSRVATMRDGDSATMMRDRMITGASTLLVQPKGLDIIDSAGLLVVTENNATSPGVLVFSTCAAGDVAPLAVVSTGTARPWDADYDEVTNTLFVALTDGTVGVYEQFLPALSTDGPDRIITPAEGGVKVSINLHGIDYDPASDSLIVSDVGSAADPADGQLFVIPGALRAEGLVDVSVRIGGASTFLGNPVDITYNGTDLYVAEKSQARILRFDDILQSAGGDLAPDAAMVATAPESVVLIPAMLRGY